MKRYTRCFILFAVLISALFSFSGCGHKTYNLEIKVENTELDGKSVDILVPVSVDDVDCYIAPYAKGNIDKEIDPNAKECLVSLFSMDCCCAYNYFDSSEQVYKVGIDQSFYKSLCTKYDTFRIALRDDKKNIITESDDCTLSYDNKIMMFGRIVYDAAENKVEIPKIYNGDNILYSIAVNVGKYMLIVFIIALVKFIVSELMSPGSMPTKTQCIVLGCMSIPNILYLVCQADYLIKKHIIRRNGGTFISGRNGNCFENKWQFVYYLIPIAIAAAYIMWYIVKSRKATPDKNDDGR